MGRHEKAVQALKELKDYCKQNTDCGKCALITVCTLGFNFEEKQIQEAQILCKRLEREDARKAVWTKNDRRRINTAYAGHGEILTSGHGSVQSNRG